MFGTILHDLGLLARAKTGASTGLIAWSVVSIVAAGLALLFLSLAGYAWLAERYGPVTAGLTLGGAFFGLAILASLICMAVRRRTAAQARAEMAQEISFRLLDPRLLSVGIQMGRAIGWKKIVPLAVIGLLAAGIAREHTQSPPEPAE
jgi:hypothetical protein